MVNVLGAINSAPHYVRIHLLTASNISIDEVHAIVDSAFSCSDEKEKQSLLAFAPSVRMSKGFCNAG